MKRSENESNIDGRSKKARGSSPQQGADQSRVSALWQSVLGLPRVGLDDNFFEIGGTSLLATVLLTRINREFGRELGIAAIFDCPSPRAMTRLLNGETASVSPQEAASENRALSESPSASAAPLSSQHSLPPGSIAIVGMTGRFPGAETVEDFWRNLASGVESITFFSDEELEIQASERGPGYVAARPILKDTAMFDAAFFGIYPKEAEQMDPQHRVFLECAWEVLERAGYDPAHTPGAVGVFAGCSMNTYFMQNLAAGRKYLEDFTGSYQVGSYVTMLGNDKDFLATRVSYKLNLRGPSITVQTACSTSLVAVNQACESLLAGGCDMALAGAVSITFPQRRGYLPQEGGLASLDGHCRPFDRRANGTVFGHGAAVLLLKRLDRAVADGDQILAVIRGVAVNNDGSGKVGYTAPSVEGQAEVVSRARKMAGVPAESITYLEAHGTGTPLGDPIEIAALNRSFRSATTASRYCSIGTAKANVGHLDVASGATGLIKTVLQMQHRSIPQLLHFEQPNPHLELDDSPFVFDREPRPWKPEGFPLRAGVSAFGVGGTNAHVIVEEAPDLPASSAGRKHQLFVWSAKSAAAADAIAGQLAAHFHANPDLNFADAAYTLQASRSRHKHRRAIQASNLAEAASALAGNDGDCWHEDHPIEGGSVVFCFPGQGIQTLGMAYGLYRDEPVFREWMDRCDAILRPMLGESLLAVLYPEATRSGNGASAGEIAVLASRLNQTDYAQPAIFAVEYSLAQLWISWGIRPAAMVGHSIGEFAAATLAGVLSLEDALRLVAARGRIMQELPAGGAMLAVRAEEETVVPLLGAKLDLAAVNGPRLMVVSGPEAEIAALVERLDAMQIQSRRLITSHAFHSRLVEPALAAFAAQVSAVQFGAPAIPYVSTLTGQWVTAEELSQTAYWTRQMREPVRFGRAIEELLRTPQRILLEVGAGETAAQMMRQTALASAPQPSAPVIVSSLASRRDGIGDDTQSMLSTLARLWLAGVDPDWTALHGEARRRVLLPTYPFERKRYWAEPPAPAIPDAAAGPFPMSANLTPVNDNRIVENTPVSASTSAEGPLMSQNANASPSNGMLEELKALVTDLSGADLAQVDGQAYFLELGFDSLFLTQLTQAIQGKYRVKLSFREIMESYPTLGGLADHLEATVAPALRAPQPAAAAAPTPASAQTPTTAAPAFTAPAVAMASIPAALTANVPAGSYEALFTSQMQMLSGLFAQQLELLRAQQTAGISAPLPAATIAAVAEAPSQIPATAPAQVAAPQKAERVPDSAAQNAKPAFTPFKPLQRGTSGGLNPTQQHYLDSFIRDYNRRTPGSKEFTQKHRQVLADGRVVSGFHAQVKEMIYPLVVDRASGAYLWDKDGNRYIDILNGFGAILYGHSPEFIVEAVRKQLEIGFPIGPQTELAGECAELVRDLTGMERVTFCNTGSEAVMGAMRLARTVTGRNLIALFTGDYHGSFDEVLVKAVGQHRSMPAAPGIPRESVANVLVLDYGSPESLEILRQRAGELAGVLVEPVQSRHPELRPVEFLREVRQLTEQNGAALIFDEVVTGFRTHPGGMQALYGIRADLATYGKVVAGGLPVGVLSGSAAYMDALDGGQWQFGDDSFPQAGVTFYAGTFMRHPLALAAVKASLEHLKASGAGLQKELAEKTSALVTDLKSMCREFSYPATLETFSSWFFLAAPTEPRLARMLHFHLREKGIHIQEGFPCFLTTAHTAADLDAVRDAFREGLRAMTEGQALTAPPEATAPAAGTSLPEPSVARAAATAPASQAAAASAPQTAPVACDFTITEPQREILFGTQLGDEANCAFNESTSLTLTGGLDSSALIASLEELIARHEALRSTVAEDGETVHVAAQTTLALEQDDLSSLSPGEREKTLESLLAREASTPFDLHRGPLFRFRLVRLERTKHVLILTAHHILFDGWSTNVLYRELSELYNARTKGVGAEMGTPLALHEYAAAQTRRHGSRELAAVESYWMDQFKTLPAPLQLPTDRPRQALRTNSGATKRYVFPGELAKSLRMAGARQGSTLFATLLAGYSLLIHRLCQQNDVVIGVPMAGQSQIENGSTLIGHCVNFLPIRSRYSPEEPLSQFLKQTRKTLLDAQDHQDYTYGTLLRALKVPRDPSRLQLVEVQFNLEQVGAGLNFNSLGVDL
ncbi:MAG TPA: aminotransferase class III-fold pyridoxal phosphate-dependent enzyme, partial [Acidobacteriaceae bacterium]|nr:aminotransferase class III-fold pyridoxal phosphate-dependent enzyme [Acidobacteriaceae bacterium]